MSYDLSQLGWKAFQDLACAVAADVLQRPIQTFLPSNDGGRDGAFIGTWDGTAGSPGKSTIQCKFMGKPGANLSLAHLKAELDKAAKLAQDGLADDYVVLTNAGVSAEADKAICAAFEAVGVKQCRVFGGGWIVQQLTERPRLRMLAPRVYGIGDLSQIITSHSYKQADAILKSMGSDLSCFVRTDAYRAALKALQEHRFVILLGDPASGKSTIAAILALGALDDGSSGAVKINDPDQMHLWHPGEKQFLWVDDAFGANHFESARMSRWNAELGALKAAVEGGAKIVFTSRNYVWEAARPNLKMSAFPLLKESQVVVNVQALAEDERAQMLYNHVRRAQPQAMRKRLKPFLPGVAANKAFLPETARRLGDPLFTKGLAITEARLTRLVEHPVEFLTEVLGQLDDPSKAAIALIFLNSQQGVPSPIMASPSLDTVTRLMGIKPAELARAMQHMNDSLTRLVSDAEGDRWVFRHPTVTDAFATLVASSPELVELYVHGAKIDRLVTEAACRPGASDHGRVRIPPSLYPSLIERLIEHALDESFKSFLGASCEQKFLAEMTKVRPDILEWAATVSAGSISLSGKLLFAALTSCDHIPESTRLRFVAAIREHSITWLDASPLKDEILRQIFKDQEFDDYVEDFRKEWLGDIPNVFSEFGRFSSGNEAGMYEEFKENLIIAQEYFDLYTDEFDQLLAQVDAHIEDMESESAPSSGAPWPPQSAHKTAGSSAAGSRVIFDDVDE